MDPLTHSPTVARRWICKNVGNCDGRAGKVAVTLRKWKSLPESTMSPQPLAYQGSPTVTAAGPHSVLKYEQT
ncbi:hypothetical protein HO173_009208 [Letharia columbiana]|uniref:Uncharacterized protein n=1 Tax=Letharia columbiana TaxID=112416 RepID=A0A8H6FPZ1_9LECA|nr:uncharacterized protein HO173_009208 [Letharia columbiana]KAF6232540.1 hypothetical protein HO173_009208 [Letharia columbiana]